MAEVSRRYRGLEDHACARCAERGVWSHLEWCPTKASGGTFFEAKGDSRVFKDDVQVTEWAMYHGAERPVTRWVHRYPATCPRCNTLFNLETYAHHVFADDELPLDYWDDHAEAAALAGARGVDARLLDAWERGYRRFVDGFGREVPHERD